MIRPVSITSGATHYTLRGSENIQDSDRRGGIGIPRRRGVRDGPSGAQGGSRSEIKKSNMKHQIDQ